MMRASLTLQEVKELVPGEAVHNKQMRLSKPPEPGVIRGRPKRCVQSSISIWQWLDDNRPDKYERISPQGLPPVVKCHACKAVIRAPRETTFHFVIQHEKSNKHKNALSSEDGSFILCSGITISQACTTLDGLAGFEDAFELWAAADFPWHNQGVSQAQAHACYRGEDTVLRIRSDPCEREKHHTQPNKDWCFHCERLAISQGFVQRVARWAFRIILVDLVHATFSDNVDRREKLLGTLSSKIFLQSDVVGWEDVPDDWSTLAYPALFEICRQKLGSIPRSVCNAAAWNLIESRFSWLSSKKPVIENLEQSSALQRYARALENGSLPSEIKLAEHVLAGKLRADSVLKTLVTALISKCARQNMKRQAGNRLPGVDETDLAETGFALATCAWVRRCENMIEHDRTI